MEQKTFESSISNIKKGTYFPITYKVNGKEGTYKISNKVVRVIQYKSTSDKPSPLTSVSQYTKINKKGELYTQFFGSKSPKHHTKTNYFDLNGVEISKEEFELINGVKTYGPNPQEIFSVHLENLIKIGK